MTRENFKKWLKTQPLCDKLVYLRYKYSYETVWTYTNECLEVDMHNKSYYTWSSDWDEGQEDVEILGCIDLTEIDVPLFDLHTENEVECVLDKIKEEILEEKDCAYADFERYKVEYLGQDWEEAYDSPPQDDYRYGMERCIDIINKYKVESEVNCSADSD